MNSHTSPTNIEPPAKPNGVFNILCFFVPVCGSLLLWRTPSPGELDPISFLALASGFALVGWIWTAVAIKKRNPDVRFFRNALGSLLGGVLASVFIILLWNFVELKRAGYPMNRDTFLSKPRQ